MSVWLRDLAAALDGWGFNVTAEPGWESRGYGGGLRRSPRGIVAHWTATAFRPNNPFPTAGLVTGGRSDLPGPLAQLMLGFDGQPRIIAAGLANHAGAGNRGVPCSGNSDMIGIECEGAGTWTPEQLANYPRLCAALWHWYSDVKFSNIVSHQEWTTRKIDIHTWPGGMSAFRASVAAASKEELPVRVPNPYSGKDEDAATAIGFMEQRVRDGVSDDLREYLRSDEFLDAVGDAAAERLLARPVDDVATWDAATGTVVSKPSTVFYLLKRAAEASPVRHLLFRNAGGTK